MSEASLHAYKCLYTLVAALHACPLPPVLQSRPVSGLGFAKGLPLKMRGVTRSSTSASVKGSRLVIYIAPTIRYPERDRLQILHHDEGI